MKNGMLLNLCLLPYFALSKQHFLLTRFTAEQKLHKTKNSNNMARSLWKERNELSLL